MPSLNFPTSPSIGAQYENWVWNGAQWDFAQTLPGGLPAGAIIQWAGATAPVNWLLCDGTAVSRTTYASLFAAVGTTYGTGDGSTTFNLPDLRGRVPVGKNGGSFGTLGASGGAETVTLDSNNLPAHSHSFSATTNTTGGHTHSLSGSNGGSANLGPSVTSNSNGDFAYFLGGGRANYNGDHSHTVSGTTGSAGSGTAVNNLQPYLVTNYIIKATAAITPGESELAPRVGILEATNALSPNYIINGAFDVWQRGASFTNPSSAYTADRWVCNGTGYNIAQITSGLPSGFISGIQSTVTSAGTAHAFSQQVEYKNIYPLIGKSAIFSFWAKANANNTFSKTVNVTVRSSTTEDQRVWHGNNSSTTSLIPVTITTSWAKYSVDLSSYIPSNAKALAFEFNIINSGSVVGDGVSFTGVQLEEGVVATPFRRNGANTQIELASCKRYYQQSWTPSAGGPTPLSVADGGLKTCAVKFEVEMRVAPTFSFTSSASVATNGTSSKQWWGYTFTAGERYIDSWTASAEL